MELVFKSSNYSFFNILFFPQVFALWFSDELKHCTALCWRRAMLEQKVHNFQKYLSSMHKFKIKLTFSFFAWEETNSSRLCTDINW